MDALLLLLKPQFIAPLVVLIFLAGLISRYVKTYRIPAKHLQHMVRETAQKVLAVKDLPVAEHREALRAIFKATPIEHSWLEFEETLHDQTLVFEGESQVVRIRATAPSAYFFSEQKIIETPLRTEYFKHLPGILTGIGIIGTFAGLMLGLSHFDASNIDEINQSVEKLLKDVLFAFSGSMCSIIAAMVITHSEKENLRQCIEALEQLTDAIDRLFDAGVGEEYLAELVRHTQESSVQTRQLKDSLVTDLREMLQNLVDTQVRENLKLAETLSASYKDSGRDMASHISSAIEESFREPLTELAKTVQAASGDQSGKVQTLLQDVLVGFMDKLESTFGGQFKGMQELLQQSISSMHQMQGAFAGLVQDMKNAGETSGQAAQQQLAQMLNDMQSGQSAMQASMAQMVGSLQQAVENIGNQGSQAGARMGEQIEKIFAESEARQQAMASQMQDFIDALKESVGKGQQDTMQGISDTVKQLGDQLGILLQNFENNRQNMDNASAEALAAQQAQMSRVMHGVRESQQDTQAAITQMMTNLDANIQKFGTQGEQAVEGIGKRLAEQESANIERQTKINGELDKFVKLIQDNIANGQNEAINKIAATVDDLGVKLNSVIEQFAKNRHQMDQDALAAQSQLQAMTRTLIEELSTQVKALLNSLQQGHDATRQTIKMLGEQTDRTVIGIQHGADKINAAATEFTTAGQQIAQITNASAGLAGQIQGSAGELGIASRELSTVLNDYRAQRDTLQRTLATVESIVATAQAEGGMRGQVLQDLKNACDQMRTLNQEANNYLGQVSDVLAKSFDAFDTGLEKSLTRSLSSFDAELDSAIKALGGGVQELTENLDVFSDMVEKSTRHHKVA